MLSPRAMLQASFSCCLLFVSMPCVQGFAGSLGTGLPSHVDSAAGMIRPSSFTAPANRKCRALQRPCAPPLRTPLAMEVETIKTPESILEMMQDAGKTVQQGIEGGLERMAIEVPLPVTGGTELDDWPGGIKQKYFVLQPMLAETLKMLNFTADEIKKQEFLGISDDAIAVWRNSEGMVVVAFATPEVLPQLQEICKSSKQLVLVNHQFFLDEFSYDETKDFIASCEIVYFLQSLSLKGPGLLPVKGYMLRQYPEHFKVARRTDEGEKEVLESYAEKPARQILDDLFFKDSEERDKNLGMFERLKRIQKEASNI